MEGDQGPRCGQSEYSSPCYRDWFRDGLTWPQSDQSESFPTTILIEFVVRELALGF